MKDLTLFVPTVRELKAIFNIDAIHEKNNITFAEYRAVTIVVTGVSKVNAAFSATIYFSQNMCSNAILLGIAGAYNCRELAIGDVVSIDKDYFIDEAKIVDGKLLTLADMGIPICFDNASDFLLIDGFKAVSSNTVSFLSSTDELANIYQSKSGAKIENMEGAAFGLVANRLNINVSQLRGISNFCGEKQDWNIKMATKRLKDSIDEIISKTKSLK